jgi:hypothetical protein
VKTTDTRWFGDTTPIGRLAQAEELVGAVVFLATPASSYITGQRSSSKAGISGRRRLGLLRGDKFLTLFTESTDSQRHHITSMQVAGLRHTHRNSGGCSGVHQIPGFENHELAHVVQDHGGTLKIMSWVEPICRRSPLTSHHRSRPGVEVHLIRRHEHRSTRVEGLAGLAFDPLATAAIRVCHSRSETSLLIVKPAMCSSACSGDSR